MHLRGGWDRQDGAVMLICEWPRHMQGGDALKKAYTGARRQGLRRFRPSQRVGLVSAGGLHPEWQVAAKLFLPHSKQSADLARWQAKPTCIVNYSPIDLKNGLLAMCKRPSWHRRRPFFEAKKAVLRIEEGRSSKSRPFFVNLYKVVYGFEEKPRKVSQKRGLNRQSVKVGISEGREKCKYISNSPHRF